jgi:hypothetical protein
MQTGDAIAKALNESFSHVLHLEAEFDSKIVPMYGHLLPPRFLLTPLPHVCVCVCVCARAQGCSYVWSSCGVYPLSWCRLRAKATPPPGSTAPPGLPSEQDGTWGRILASCVNDFESLSEVGITHLGFFSGSLSLSPLFGPCHCIVCVVCVFMSGHGLVGQWEGLLHFNIGRSVETLTRYTSAFEETKNWSIAYRVSILKLMDDFSAVMRFRHEGQVRA